MSVQPRHIARYRVKMFAYRNGLTLTFVAVLAVVVFLLLIWERNH